MLDVAGDKYVCNPSALSRKWKLNCNLASSHIYQVHQLSRSKLAAMGLRHLVCDLCFNPRHTKWIAPLLIAGDALLCALIIWKVSCKLIPHQPTA